MVISTGAFLVLMLGAQTLLILYQVHAGHGWVAICFSIVMLAISCFNITLYAALH